MRLVQFWVIVLISFFALIQRSAIAGIENLQPQQAAQAGEKCHGQQILQAQTCAGDSLEPEEEKLYQLVNQYRAQNGLPPIPISPSLNLVANRHVRDLVENISPSTYPHSWSDCRYDASNQNTWSCMWTAPQRLGTPYSSRGYENLFGGRGGYVATADKALWWWQSDPPHNDVIVNQGIWRNIKWNAVGVGIYRGYAAIWFGEEPDPAISPNGTSGGES